MANFQICIWTLDIGHCSLVIQLPPTSDPQRITNGQLPISNFQICIWTLDIGHCSLVIQLPPTSDPQRITNGQLPTANFQVTYAKAKGHLKFGSWELVIGHSACYSMFKFFLRQPSTVNCFPPLPRIHSELPMANFQLPISK